MAKSLVKLVSFLPFYSTYFETDKCTIYKITQLHFYVGLALVLLITCWSLDILMGDVVVELLIK